MMNFDAGTWTEYILQHNNPLLVVGEGCMQVSLNGRGLIDYAVSLAEKLSCPVAATGNTFPAVRERSPELKAKKMYLAEVFRYLEEEWKEPLLKERPDLLLLVGYRPRMIRGLTAGAQDVHLAHLGPGLLPSAQLSMGEIPLAEWGRNLEALINNLQAAV